MSEKRFAYKDTWWADNNDDDEENDQLSKITIHNKRSLFNLRIISTTLEDFVGWKKNTKRVNNFKIY